MKTVSVDVKDLKKVIPTLHAYDKVLLSGTVYTSRDAAHKRIIAALENKEEPPYPIEGAAVYYAGPTEAREGMAIGSCGPTTSGRMDVFAPALLDRGLLCMIGKGPRNQAVTDAIRRNGAIYLCALGGAGALACQCITDCQVIAYEDLGCESVKKLTFRDFPLVVGIDCEGNSVFGGKK